MLLVLESSDMNSENYSAVFLNIFCKINSVKKEKIMGIYVLYILRKICVSFLRFFVMDKLRFL